ncbi:MAG: FAD-dependent oxidoreductase [Eubacterium sp.]|nr:FAD-dependent oxidoreductase [Eubacterium sp.]
MAYVINQELCSCCHRCRVECPAEAIRFKDSKYYIDPDKCIDCGHCATVCHNNVISNPDIKEEIISHPVIEKECDVLVVGGGASGLSAAAKAQEEGKKVLVIEKNKEIGGSAWYAHCFRNLYSVWHKEAGIEDERAAKYDEFMEKTEGMVDGEVLQRIFDANVDFVDWLIEKHNLGKDYKFDRLFWGGMGPMATYDWEYNHKRIDTAIGPGGTGWFLCNKLLDIFEKCGGEILYNTALTDLKFDADGKICGASAKDKGGSLEIKCSKVVLAAGSFSRNKKLTNEFNPIFYKEGTEPVHVFTCSTCTGDAIEIARKHGADIDFENARVAMFGPMRHPFGTASLNAARSHSGFEVNYKGEVFENGGFGEMISPLAHDDKRYLWKILDEATIEEEMERSKGKPEDVPGCNMDRFFDEWREDFERETAWGATVKAETLEEMANKLDIPYNKLLEAAEEYNKTCGVEVEEMTPFGLMKWPPKREIKDGNGPFYALREKLFHENAIGGMVIDGHMNVLKDGKPIEGLYACGDNTRGIMVPGKVGVAYVESVISALTFAFSSGYACGEECSK